jgi:hypothetical protein
MAAAAAAHRHSLLRLHGAGDGSVMAYCGACREALPHLPRPATLGAVQAAWTAHLQELSRAEEARG